MEMGFFEFNEKGGLKTDKVMRRPANPYAGDLRSKKPFKFGGETFKPKRDGKRLTGQALIIFNIVKDGKWRTPQRLEKITGFPVTSITARLRDFRRPQFGSHTVLREHIGNGLHRYKLIVNRSGSK